MWSNKSFLAASSGRGRAGGRTAGGRGEARPASRTRHWPADSEAPAPPCTGWPSAPGEGTQGWSQTVSRLWLECWEWERPGSSWTCFDILKLRCDWEYRNIFSLSSQLLPTLICLRLLEMRPEYPREKKTFLYGDLTVSDSLIHQAEHTSCLGLTMAWYVPCWLLHVTTSPIYLSSSKYEVISSMSAPPSALQGSHWDRVSLQSCSVAWDRSVLQWQSLIVRQYTALIDHLNRGESAAYKWFIYPRLSLYQTGLIWSAKFGRNDPDFVFVCFENKKLPSIELIVTVEPIFVPWLCSSSKSTQQRFFDDVYWLLVNNRVKFSCKEYFLFRSQSLEQIAHLFPPNDVGGTPAPIYSSTNKKYFSKYKKTFPKSA